MVATWPVRFVYVERTIKTILNFIIYYIVQVMKLNTEIIVHKIIDLVSPINVNAFNVKSSQSVQVFPK